MVAGSEAEVSERVAQLVAPGRDRWPRDCIDRRLLETGKGKDTVSTRISRKERFCPSETHVTLLTYRTLSKKFVLCGLIH